MEKDTQEKIQQLSMFEQNIQQVMMQKQQLMGQMVEIDSALKEINDDSYKIIGNIMIKTKKEDLEKSLSDKKEIINLKMKQFEKQENQIIERKEKIQKEVMEEMKK